MTTNDKVVKFENEKPVIKEEQKGYRNKKKKKYGKKEEL